MPNSANRKAGDNKSGTGHKEDVNNKRNEAKPNPERSDKKHGTAGNDGNTNRTSNQGQKAASGGSAED
jgi:hypothetical protein